MRITHQTIAAQTMLDMQLSLRQVEKTRSEVSSGRRLLHASDDPVDAVRAMGYRNKVSGIKQHIRNIDHALMRLSQTENVLGHTNEVLMQLKQLALQLGTQPTVNHRDRENAVEEIQQFRDQIIQFTNTKVGSQFIFAGSKTHTRPFENRDGQVFYNGNDDEISIEVEEHSTVQINIAGNRVFDTSEDGIFQMLDDFETALRQNNKGTLKTILEQVDTHTETVLNARAINAARMRRMEIARDRLFDNEIETTRALSQTEDADLARAITEFANQQNSYQATLSSTARVLQPSLLSVLG